MKSLNIFVLFALALPVMAFDPITVVSGTTAYVLTSIQVAVAVASVGALALAAEGLILAELSRGKRDAYKSSNTRSRDDTYPDSIIEADTDDCTKLIICNS